MSIRTASFRFRDSCTSGNWRDFGRALCVAQKLCERLPHEVQGPPIQKNRNKISEHKFMGRWEERVSGYYEEGFWVSKKVISRGALGYYKEGR